MAGIEFDMSRDTLRLRWRTGETVITPPPAIDFDNVAHLIMSSGSPIDRSAVRGLAQAFTFPQHVEELTDDLVQYCGELIGAGATEKKLADELKSLLVGLGRAADETYGAAATASSSILFNSQLSSKYIMLKPIAQGGSGNVYLARDGEAGKPVAIKVLSSSGSSRNEVRFRQEASILATLSHPGLVRYLESGQLSDGRPYIVQDFVEGVDLEHYLRSANMKLAQKMTVFASIADALGYLHEHMIIHRDLKPSNILIRKDGSPVIIDFGIARMISPTLSGHSEGFVGTLAYMSPEQSAERSVDCRSDIYSLGAVMWELVYGSSPVGLDLLHTTLRDALNRIEHTYPLSPRKPGHRSRIEKDFEAICIKCLEKDPRKRYASANILSGDLVAAVAGGTISSRRHTFIDRIVYFLLSRPRQLRNWFASIFLLAIIVGFYQVELTASRLEAERHAVEVERQRRQGLEDQLKNIANQVFVLESKLHSDGPKISDDSKELLAKISALAIKGSMVPIGEGGAIDISLKDNEGTRISDNFSWPSGATSAHIRVQLVNVSPGDSARFHFQIKEERHSMADADVGPLLKDGDTALLQFRDRASLYIAARFDDKDAVMKRNPEAKLRVELLGQWR